MFASTITTNEIEELAQVDYSGKIKVIDSLGKDFDKSIQYLNSLQVIGFDTETKPCFISGAPRNRTAILQLSGGSTAYIYRLQALGIPKELAQVLENPRIIKVGAAVKDDIIGLKRYCRFHPHSFIDLQVIADKFGIEERSVKKLSAIILGKKVSKSQQLSNWESAQLSEAQLRYAAIDAWVCREMYIKLMGSDD